MLRLAKWWMPTAATMLLSLLSYVDRNVLAVLSATILSDTGLSVESYGRMISAFSVAYLVGNPAWGRALDRFGVRWGLGVAVALWTCASVSHAFATTALTFSLARAALGFGEGATFPGGLRTANQTLRVDQRSRGVALAYSGGSLGAIVTPIVVTPIALRWGWHGAFVFTGLLGAAWLGVWALVSRDPRLTEDSRARPGAGDDPGVRPPPHLRESSVWGFMAAYAFGGLPPGFILYGAPIHLARGLGCDQRTLGHLLWIPPLGWEVGYFFWGWIMDRAARQGTLGPRLFRRSLASLAALALALSGAPLLRSRLALMALLFFAMFVSAGFVIVSLAETTRRHGPDHGGYLAGLGAGSWAALMAVAMPFFGRLFDRNGYGTAYALASIAPGIGWIGWRGLAAIRGEDANALG